MRSVRPVDFGQRTVDHALTDRDDLGVGRKRNKSTHWESPVMRSSEPASVPHKWQNPPTAGGFAIEGATVLLQIPPRMHASSNRTGCCCWASCAKNKNMFTERLTRYADLSRDESQTRWRIAPRKRRIAGSYGVLRTLWIALPAGLVPRKTLSAVRNSSELHLRAFTCTRAAPPARIHRRS
jgi:hypothetical protein